MLFKSKILHFSHLALKTMNTTLRYEMLGRLLATVLFLKVQ